MINNKCILLLSLYSLNRLSEIDKLIYELGGLDIDLSIEEHNKDNKDLLKFTEKYQHRIVNVNFHKNYGVDISPFIHQVCSIDPEEYPMFIKLHSKESKWGTKSHVDWGTVLMDCYIGNSYNYIKNLQLLSRKHIGMISHNFLTLNDREYKNTNKIKYLCESLGLDYDKVEKSSFAAGSMFMSKTNILQKYLKSKKEILDILLSTETGKVNDSSSENGTYCHAMERIFGYIMKNENLLIHPHISKTIPIFNTEHRRLHLSITYNNYCYLREDLNIYGKLLSQNNDKLKIQWLHLQDSPIVEYIKTSGKLVRDNHFAKT